MSTAFSEYQSALSASDEATAALIMDRAAEDFSLTLSEFLELIKVFDRLFLS